MEEEYVFAICFNQDEKARALAEKLSRKFPGSTFIINACFDSFLKELSSHPRIDCFITEEFLESCSSIELIRKIKRSRKYKRTVTLMNVLDLKSIKSALTALKCHFLYDDHSDLKPILDQLAKTLQKSRKPAIPEHFNILIVDNQEDFLEMISMYLGALDHHRFDLCMSKKSALEMLQRNHYDILMLDWNLDDGTCLEIMEFLGNDPHSKQLKNDQALTIVITGRDGVEDIMTLLQYGVKDHIIKPFDFYEFEDKVMYALEKHRLGT